MSRHARRGGFQANHDDAEYIDLLFFAANLTHDMKPSDIADRLQEFLATRDPLRDRKVIAEAFKEYWGKQG